jgi:phenylacetate-CoA ligase
MSLDPTVRHQLCRLDRASLVARQFSQLARLWAAILPVNGMYGAKLASAQCPRSPAELAELPLTTKDELLPSPGHGPWPANLTWPIERYVRFHQTSGTRGSPLAVLDTAEDWQWWIGCWSYVYDAMGLEPADRVLLAFSFGPFVGFWAAFDAALARGAMAIPAGGMSTRARLDLARRTRATVLCATPSYALHLAETARDEGFDVGRLSLRALLLAGEPGGSVPAVRARLESAFHAAVFDHAGASEIGPWGLPDPNGEGLFVNEAEFIAEFLVPHADRPAADGELAELVLTNLGRAGSPLLRYRTGDLVRPVRNHSRATRFAFLDGGIVGRADEMLVVRGVNLFPGGLEQILRGIEGVAEYRATVYKKGELDEFRVEIEAPEGVRSQAAGELEVRLGLRVEVACVPRGTLPRFEGKGKRIVDQRAAGPPLP